jgi:FlaG/FlaF family flagellin (archaellin)
MMKKRTASLLTAFILLVAVAFALNGSVISITNTTPYAGGGTGALQCVYSTQSDANHVTQWKIRKLNTTTWGSLRAMGTTAGSITTGPNYVDYEVQFVPPAGDNFTGTNPVSVRVYPNKLSVVTIHYQ